MGAALNVWQAPLAFTRDPPSPEPLCWSSGWRLSSACVWASDVLGPAARSPPALRARGAPALTGRLPGSRRLRCEWRRERHPLPAPGPGVSVLTRAVASGLTAREQERPHLVVNAPSGDHEPDLPGRPLGETAMLQTLNVSARSGATAETWAPGRSSLASPLPSLETRSYELHPRDGKRRGRDRPHSAQGEGRIGCMSSVPVCVLGRRAPLGWCPAG